MSGTGEQNIDPTPRRRQQAREEGRVPRSAALSSAITIVGGIAVLMTFAQQATQMIYRRLRQHLGGQVSLSIEREQAISDWQELTVDVLTALVPLLAGFLLVALLASLVQSGFLLIPKNALPQLGRLSPLKGVRRMMSSVNLVSVSIGLLQAAAAVAIAWWCLQADLPGMVRLAELQPEAMLRSAGSILLSAAMKIGLGLFAVALLDYAYRRWNHERELRMTPEQARDELRMIEGDPQLAERRRQIRRVPAQH